MITKSGSGNQGASPLLTVSLPEGWYALGCRPTAGVNPVIISLNGTGVQSAGFPGNGNVEFVFLTPGDALTYAVTSAGAWGFNFYIYAAADVAQD